MHTKNIYHKLKSNFLSLAFLQIITSVLPLVTLPYLIKTLGIEKFGLIAFAQSFVMFFNLFVDYGSYLFATKEISVFRTNASKLTEIYSAIMSIKVMLSIISLIIFCIIIFSVDKFSDYYQLYLVTFTIVIGNAMFPTWYFQGIEKMHYVGIVGIIAKIFFTVFIFIIIKKETDYIFVPLIQGIGLIFSGIISLLIVHKIFKQQFKLQTISVLFNYFKNSSQFFLSNLSESVYRIANIFILGLFVSNTIVGYYAIAEKLYLTIARLYDPIAQTLYPYMAKDRNISLFKKIFISVVLINIVVITIIYLFDTSIIQFVLMQNIHKETIVVFNIFLVALIVIVPALLLGYPFLGAFGYSKYVNKGVFIISIIHLTGLMILFLTDNISIYNVAFLITATQIFILSYRVYGAIFFKKL